MASTCARSSSSRPPGAFLRTITWLQNPGTVDVAVDVDVTADFGDGLGWALTGASTGSYYSLSTADTWAHAGHGTSASEAGAAWGAGATAVRFQRGSNGDGVFRAGVTASFSVMVPAGQRLGLLAFAVGRAQNLGVPAQVRALADLSDPEALEGLSESDRQQIVNFTVPLTPNPPTGVEGTVTRDGVPSVGAGVVAIDDVSSLVLAYGSTDASGHFALPAVACGRGSPGGARSLHEPSWDHDRHRHGRARDDGRHRAPSRHAVGHGAGHGLQLFGGTGARALG